MPEEAYGNSDENVGLCMAKTSSLKIICNQKEVAVKVTTALTEVIKIWFQGILPKAL
jgi:hypothetical protein